MMRTWSAALPLSVWLAFFLFVPVSFTQDRNIADIFNGLCADADVMHLNTDGIEVVKAEALHEVEEKEWTIILYIAADNNLAPFAIRNIRQMARVGSNNNFNIVVQLDIHKANGQKVTRRYYIEKDKILHVNADDPYTQKMDSGDPESLISCCGWAINGFPAKKYALVFWNHGSGILDPERSRLVGAEELFRFNEDTRKLELDRSIGYCDRMMQRGVCFDDTTGNYLTNADLDYALETICEDYLGGKKFEFIAFDACLMPMIEIANLIKEYAHYMIGSQESGLGYGWNYADVLQTFTSGAVETVDCAHYIVSSYEKAYEKIVSDYTLSASDLDRIDLLEKNLNDVACLLIKGLREQKEGMVKKTIKASRNKFVCTHFDEPSYIDIHHFYGNLLANLQYMKLLDPRQEELFKASLIDLLEEGRSLIESIVFAYTHGKRLALARGLSVYFPERRIHSSYERTTFAQDNQWVTFLKQYLIL